MAQFVEVSTASGPVKFAMWVSTPSGGTSIDPSLPTVLFIHAHFVASYVWREQFADPHLRRFNLVGLDLRDHGWTQCEVPETYSQEDAAADVAAFLDAASLPPVFICAVSSGTITAIQLAVNDPSRIAGMFLISPLGTEETEHAGQARREICAVWKEGMADPGGKLDEEALQHAISGAFQLALTERAQAKPISICVALLGRTQCIQFWSHPRLRQYETITCTYDCQRHGHSQGTLSSLTAVPIKLVTGTGDFAYDDKYYSRFERQLREAGVKLVEREIIPGAPHWMHLSFQDEISKKLCEFVMRHWVGDIALVPPALGVPEGEGLPTMFDEPLQLEAFLAQLDEMEIPDF